MDVRNPKSFTRDPNHSLKKKTTKQQFDYSKNKSKLINHQNPHFISMSTWQWIKSLETCYQKTSRSASVTSSYNTECLLNIVCMSISSMVVHKAYFPKSNLFIQSVFTIKRKVHHLHLLLNQISQ